MNGLKLVWQCSLVLGFLLVLGGLVGPMIQLPGSMYRTGPGSLPGSANSTGTLIPASYWTDTFETPPVRAGQTIRVQAAETGPGKVLLQVVQQNPSGNLPDAYTLTLDSSLPAVDLSIPVKFNNPFLFLITSYNSTYTITVSGTWAIFYDWSLGIYWGSILLLIGIVVYYYYTIVERRESVYRKAMSEISQKGSGGSP